MIDAGKVVEVFTREQKHAAFEWLRRVSLDATADSDHAACMLYEVSHLKKLEDLAVRAQGELQSYVDAAEEAGSDEPATKELIDRLAEVLFDLGVISW